MPDEGSVAVADPVIDTGAQIEDTSVDPGASEAGTGQPDAPEQQPDKQDGRKQPDALKKHIADLRRRADAITDPTEKKAELDRIKFLYDTSGKARAYEESFPTVREAREVKALLESVGGRDGLTQIQGTIESVRQIDEAFERGDLSIADRMWEEAKDGMIRLAPAIFAKLEQVNQQEYTKAVTPHAVKFFDNAGFPEAFDQMVSYFKDGKKAEGEAIATKLANWFASQRNATPTEKQADPEVERLRQELAQRDQQGTAQAVNRAYNDVVSHAAPIIDTYLKPMVAKLNLSPEQYKGLRADVWNHLQDSRNSDPTYKTVASAKYKQGIDQAAAYIKSETVARAEASARARVNFWYGNLLRNDAKKPVNATQNPASPAAVKGEMPKPSEIDYGPSGISTARKAGFKDVGDMVLSGKAPLKGGGIRQWR